MENVGSDMTNANECQETPDPLTVESLDAAFRLAAEARDEFTRYCKMFPNRTPMVKLATLIETPYANAAEEINKRLALYRIQQKQELAIRTIHKWCDIPEVVEDTEAQTMRIAAEHKAWSDKFKDGGDGAWSATLLADEKFMPPPDETLRQSCREIARYDEMLTRYENVIRKHKEAAK